MSTDARYEKDVLAAYEAGKLKSVATKTELGKLRAAARATSIKDRRVNIRLSTSDLLGIQARALEEGVPYQTLIASVLHKFISGRLVERRDRVKAPGGSEPSGRGTKGGRASVSR
ncbi:MAG: hypothetical protein IT522_06235 [Burkholderiales bacterium]|nr:hypothetical protein [Burkholderiales bacterium]